MQGYPEAVRLRSNVVGLACVLGLACADAPELDPLDRELIRELSLERGSAVGDQHGGTWSFEFQVDDCDCPSVEVDGLSYDLCELVPFVPADVQVTHANGLLAVSFGQITATGAIESDGSFIVASLHDESTVIGPLESLARLDGQFDQDSTSAEGWAGQRLIGDLAGDPLDCRRTGTFVAHRPN
jgi:hypothetical protein